MSNFRKLFRLQMLEAEQRKQAQKGTSVADTNRLKQLKQEIESLQGQLKELKGQHQSVKAQGQQLALNSQQLREQCTQIDAKIYDGSMQMKEIAGYQQKLTKLKGEATTLEDRELDVMQQREDIKKEWEEKKQRLDALTLEFKQLHQTYLKAKEEIKSRAQGLAREEKALIQEIEPGLLQQYQELKTKYPNPVSRVTKDICSGCHLGISFDKLKHLKYQTEPTYCNHCGRILFWDPAPNATVE